MIVTDNNVADLDMCGSAGLGISGELGEGSRINLTNALIDSVGEVVLVKPAAGYTITESDLAAFTYVPTEVQNSSGLIMGDLYINKDGIIVMDVSMNDNDIYWADGTELEAMDIVGGSEEDPVVITVGGTVTLQGKVTISAGYVQVIAEEGK